MADLHTQDYSGEYPRWRPVPLSSLDIAPYSRTCRVLGRKRDEWHLGSGWFASTDLVLTAAHVVASAEEITVWSTNYEVVVARSAVAIDPRYWDGDGREMPCSVFDFAHINVRPLEGVNFGTRFQISDDGPDRYRVVGFDNETLVERAGDGQMCSGLIVHSADTQGGHSGAPVFHLGRWCGLHVGTLAASAAYVSFPEEIVKRFRNCAIPFSA